MPTDSGHYRITIEDVLEAHDIALTYGGSPGTIDLGRIEAAIARPYVGYYDGIEEKAAALVESLARNHGFVDANKRTTFAVLGLFVECSGYDLFGSSEESLARDLEEMIVAAAEGRMRFDDLRA